MGALGWIIGVVIVIIILVIILRIRNRIKGEGEDDVWRNARRLERGACKKLIDKLFGC